MPLEVTIKQLLEAGVHFGHQTKRWNPKMKKYVFTERNGIYIIDLQQTLALLEKAYEFIVDLVSKGGVILFVGTKKQVQEAIRESAQGCGMPYVSNRWLGGMLTNFSTIRTRIERLRQLEKMEEEGRLDLFPKKEATRLRKELEKLRKNIEGIKTMDKLPDALFIIDPRKEEIAVREARKLNIPIVAIVDTNCDPDLVDYVIPGNDDAIRAGMLFCSIVANAVKEGREKMPEVVMAEEGLAETQGGEEEAPIVDEELAGKMAVESEEMLEWK